MNHSKRIVAAAVVLLLLGIGFKTVRQVPNEPAFRGKSLREWLSEVYGKPTGQSNDVQEAFWHMRSNAAPWLTAELNARSFHVDLWFLNPNTRGSHPLFTIMPPSSRRFLANEGFWLFRRNVREAVPDLIALIKNGNDPIRIHAFWALQQVGPDAVAALPLAVQYSTNSNLDVCWNAVRALGEMGQTAVPGLIMGLKSQHSIVRESAAEGLEKLGPYALPALEALIKTYSDTNFSTEMSSIRAIGNIGPAAARAVPDLLELAKHQSSPIRHEAILSLAKIGPAANSAIPALTALLGDKDLSNAAGYALAKMGEASIPILETLVGNDSDFILKHYALNGLAAMARNSTEAVSALLRTVRKNAGYAGDVADGIKSQPEASARFVSVLVEMLGDVKAGRSIAIDALGKLGHSATSAVPALCLVANDSDPFFQKRIAQTLGDIGFNDPSAIQVLHQALTNQYVRLVFTAIQSLAKIDPKSENTHIALEEALKDPDPIIRLGAVLALKDPPSQFEEAIPLLVQCSRDRDANVRNGAIGALGRFRPVEPRAIQLLISALENEDSKVRTDAAQALGQMGSVAIEAAPKLIALLKDLKEVDNETDPTITSSHNSQSRVNQAPTARTEAARALGSIGSGTADTVSALCECLKEKDEAIQIGAGCALAQLTEKRPEIIATLIQFAQSNTSHIRFAAIRALGEIKSTSPPALTALIAAVDDSQPKIRAYAARKLGGMGRQSGGALPLLKDRLQDNDKEVRLSSACALAQLEPAYPATIPVLIEALKDGTSIENSTFRTVAAETLGKLGPLAREAEPLLRIAFLNDDNHFIEVARTALLRINQPNSTSRSMERSSSR